MPKVLFSLLAIVLVLIVSGCTRWGYWAADGSDGGTGQADATDAGHDAGADLGADPGGDAGSDSGDNDLIDAGADTDTEPDLCSSVPDDDSLALFNFETDQPLADATGQHPDANTFGPIDYVTGPDGCGQAVRFDQDEASYLYLDDHSDWNLTTGSIDFWMRIEQYPEPYCHGIVSRDASLNDLPGHFSAMLLPDGMLAARLQDIDGSTIMCTGPGLPTSSWIHVAVNLGEPAELWVQGQLATFEGRIDLPMRVNSTLHWTCGSRDGGHDLGANDNPWILGADGITSDEGALGPVWRSFEGGAIDHFRISTRRRDFSAP